MDRLSDVARLEGWIPIRFYWSDGHPMVDWCYLGHSRLAEPFFEQTIGKCLQLPFNLLFRHQTPIEVLGRLHDARPGLTPTGFIFHESRCGSTLVARMLAALERNVVISEARPIDSILRANFHSASITDEQRITWLRWLMSALAQPRRGETNFFVKFDAWNILDLPLVRQAFPEVPWIFLYRDPVEVLVSQMNHRGAHMVPGVINPALFGMNAEVIWQIEPVEYCARVLAAICQAALQHHEAGGLLVNYRQLPEAALSTISDFFGVSWIDDELEMMRRIAEDNAKNTTMIFQNDSSQKQEKASEQVREAANKWLYPLLEQLENAREAEAIAAA